MPPRRTFVGWLSMIGVLSVVVGVLYGSKDIRGVLVAQQEIG